MCMVMIMLLCFMCFLLKGSCPILYYCQVLCMSLGIVFVSDDTSNK